jgi:hypothetical protein
MKYTKGEKVLWNGTPAIIHDVITENPRNGEPVKWYSVKRDIDSVASHLVSEDAGTLQKVD